jgi:gamma-F420-2:alpha-L-glutamate ligase
VNREQFGDLASLLDGARPGEDFIFQQYIAASHGRDVRVLVIDGRAVAAMERRSADGGFKSNISLGGIGARFELPGPMAELAVRVAEVLGLDVAGVDLLLDGDDYRVWEANSSPRFQDLEKACQVNVPEEIFRAMQARYDLPGRARVGFWRRLAGSPTPRIGRGVARSVPARAAAGTGNR